jgi:hypothetical protein
MAMGEPLRKIAGGDFERNNEASFDLDDLPSTSMICFTPHRRCHTPLMLLTIPTNAE